MSRYPVRADRTESHPLTGFLGILLLIALIPSIYVVPLERVLFQPETYQKAVAVQEPDRQMAEIFANLVTREPETLDPELVRTVGALNQEEIEELFLTVLPDRWAQNQSDRVIEGMLSYLNGQSEQLSLPVDLTPLKNSLDAHSQELSVGIVLSWPPCTAEILLEMGVQVLNGQLTEIPFCQPNDLFRPLVEQLVSASIRFSASRLPQFIDLAVLMNIEGNPGWWPFYRVLRVIVLAAPIFALILLLVILALIGPGSPEALRAIGQAFLLAAVAAVILLAVLALVLSPLLRFVFDSPLVLLPEGMTDFFLRIFQVSGLRVALSVLVWSGLSAVIGLSLWVGTQFLRPRLIE